MKKIFKILSSFLLALTFVSCGTLVKPNSSSSSSSSGIGGGENPTVGDSGIEFTVTLLLNDKPFNRCVDTTVNWSDGVSLYTADVNVSGVGSIIGLDGEYEVTLSNLPEGYTYDPNVYTTSNDDPNIEIVIWELYYPRIIEGETDGSDLYKSIKIQRTGVFRTTIESARQIVYYEFAPMQNGQYVIESIVDTRANEVNPIANVHVGTFAYKPSSPSYILNDESDQCSTYTKNFLYEIKVDASNVGNVYSYGIRATQINGNYPVTVDFLILREDEYKRGSSRGVMKYSTFLNGDTAPKRAQDPESGYEWVGAETDLVSQKIFESDNYVYSDPNNGGDGFYHVDTVDGPLLYAKISSANTFIDPGFNSVEDAGNKALTLSNGKENFKLMIEGYSSLKAKGYYITDEEKIICEKYPFGYAQYCNSDGAYPVNAEIQDFLQKYAVAHRFFADGNGRCESMGYYADEDDQWLFACGYYVKTS